jgi:acyl-CoA synthetase (AMP-forming)/AMP-acid ligase II
MASADRTMNETLSSLFTWRCHQAPNEKAYAFIRDRLDEPVSISYAELAARVQCIAAAIVRKTRPNDRVLLVYPAGLEVVSAFWACMLAGRIAVPVPAPDPLRFKNGAPRLQTIIEDAQATLVLTSSELLAPAQAFCDENDLHEIAWHATAEASTRDAWKPDPAPVIAPTDIAYLQYTSGSTAAPRGVMLSHANVLAQCRSAVHDLALSEGNTRMLCWLPHYHDYGLVFGFLWPLFAGVPGYLMSPVTFLRRPLRWLEAVEAFGITHTGAPNFAYAACIKALAQQRSWHAQLDTLVSSTCGAEPIQSETVSGFQAAFGPHGLKPKVFSPSYGMAETVLGVTTTALDASALVMALDAEQLAVRRVQRADAQTRRVREVVACGSVVHDMQVQIVDPDKRTRCGDDQIGEIWVRGGSVASCTSTSSMSAAA